MNNLRAAVDEYLEMRHALGYKLKDAGAALPTFISFLEKHGKSYITMKLALEWSMQCADVDLQEGILTIRRTKFGKSRLVPVHASTKQVLAEYAQRRHRFLCRQTSQFFFVSDRGRPLAQRTVRQTFHKVSRQMGLRGAKQSHGPRLHDFRHYFACQTLVSWYRSGQDVDRCVPILSTYLGHVGITSTYWYLSLCPELMGLAAARLGRRWEGRE